jgi:all-trans-8'-apo-beta-carotenal 15,15'-oxygenase
MDRRRFLSSSAAFGALGLASASALADADTYRRFHAALERDPKLAMFADTAGAQAGTATVLGRLPADLNGVFYRNGPGRFELGGERYHHWFDGDGFAQRWQIQGGTVQHRGSFVQTQKFTEETAAGQFLYPAFGTHVARRPAKSNDTVNAANTNLLPFNGRLYALWEGGSATELDPDTLATRGLVTWRDDLKSMPFSAHPKVDPQGNLWNFGGLPGGDKLAVYHIGPDAKLRRANVLDVPKMTMVHDFVVSAAHLIFLIPPYDMQWSKGASFSEMHQWAGAQRGARIVVVSKADLTLRKVFELPPHMAFHFGNAFDDGATTRFDVVLHDGDALAGFGKLMQGEESTVDEHSFTAQVTLDYASGKASVARIFGVSEFPRVMPQVVAGRHRKLALLGRSARASGLDTVNMLDIDTGKADTYAFGAGWRVEEHVLVPRARARSETDGYLVGVAQDLRRTQTVLTVFDAARVAAGPLAMARLPYRSPYCFHGNFLSA